MERLSEIDPDDQEALLQEAFRVHGQIVHHAALADCFLFEIFHHFSGCTRPIAQAIFFTLDSANAKETLVMRTARAADADEETSKLVKKLAGAISKVIKHRNDIAHAFLLSQDPVFEDGRLELVNPKHAHSDKKASHQKNAPSSKSHEKLSNQVSVTSLQKTLRDSNLHLSTAMQEFLSLCRHIGIQPRLALEVDK